MNHQASPVTVGMKARPTRTSSSEDVQKETGPVLWSHEPVRLTANVHIHGQRENAGAGSIPSMQGRHAAVSGIPVLAPDRVMGAPSSRHPPGPDAQVDLAHRLHVGEVTAHQRDLHLPSRVTSDGLIRDLPNPFHGLRAGFAVSEQRVLAGAVSRRGGVRPRKRMPRRPGHEPLPASLQRISKAFGPPGPPRQRSTGKAWPSNPITG